MTNEIYEIIQQIAIKAVEATKPCCVLRGVIVKIAPIEIDLGDLGVIDEDFLIKTEAAKNNLSVGAKVVLLRLPGGQDFLILDKVVDNVTGV